MPGTLIIAYGNPLRCDDGVAWRAAEELTRLNLPGDIEIITRHQLTPELASIVSESSLVVFVDAAYKGAPGEIVSLPAEPKPQSSIFTHEFSPASILSAARELFSNSPKAFVVSIAGQNFDHGETLSTTVTESVPRLLTSVLKLLQ
jgi:hydrogenase maturation protease